MSETETLHEATNGENLIEAIGAALESGLQQCSFAWDIDTGWAGDSYDRLTRA